MDAGGGLCPLAQVLRNSLVGQQPPTGHETISEENTVPWRQEAELRTRIAKHLSGRVRPPAATTQIEAASAKENSQAIEVAPAKAKSHAKEAATAKEFASQEEGWTHEPRRDKKRWTTETAIHPYYISSIKTTDLRCLSSSQQLQERYRELRSRHASCRGARMKRREKPTPQVFPVALHSGNQSHR